MSPLHRLRGAVIDGLAAAADRTMRRPPDFVVHTRDGAEYLRRWYVLPRNPLLNVYVHRFVASDDDRALHDHPWASLSVILDGAYLEWLPAGPARTALGLFPRYVRRLRWRGDVTVRGARQAHRVQLVGSGCTTLFVTGPRVRRWGFWCTGGWVRHDVFVAPGPDGRSRGCA